MEGRYILELRNRDLATIEDPVLNGSESTEIEGLSDKLVKLQSLNMVLQSLKNLPELRPLGKLDISCNSIVGDLEHVTYKCPDLLHPNIASNKIAKIENLESHEKMKLCELDLLNNPLSAGSAGGIQN
ncbi:unnamed protein product [Heligmosomoides polygyrus]|uniref:LRRcap domain-containing protein n=1 Tax=Heligmosomoides polygyrus TaxID=6339 RepID=A0A183G4G6_HELPZ|nr:unnamed protein product [Heligmosomoides polygyrus]